MKLVVFAYKPPPHHGQSFMVGQMIAGFGGDQRGSRRNGAPASLDGASASRFGIECFHVNANLASDLEDAGKFRLAKMLKLFKYIAEAIWCRFRYGAKNLYYAPAPSLRPSVIRDWIILSICRPFFPKTILYWHAAGLAEWLESQPKWFRQSTHLALDRVDLSMAPSQFAISDAERFRPRKSIVVPYGLPDPCPNFENTVLPHRRSRTISIRKSLQSGLSSEPPKETDGELRIRILFLALCSREKGLIDAVQAIHFANQEARQRNVNVKFEIMVAGAFWTETDQTEFHRTIREFGLETLVHYAGFLKGEQKKEALIRADLFCFPSYYPAESFGLVLVEAMAFGLPIVTTRWRSIPEFFSRDYPGLVDIRAPEQIAAAFFRVLDHDYAELFRRKVTEEFSLDRHLTNLAYQLRQVAS
jgi:glycosyltransferase involved in cell wall biosynthesis